MDELISKQSAISLAGDLQIHGDEYRMYNQAINNYCAEIMRLPPTESERESIKWIPHKSVFGGSDEIVYTCSKCGYNIGFHVENFCPNCGGKYER